MGYSAEETYDVYDETHPKARKPHKCDACSETIPPGHRYTRVGIVYDGEARTVLRCARCQKIREHLRTLSDRQDPMWPDEELNCGEEYKAHWGREPPPEVAALAFALPKDEVE